MLFRSDLILTSSDKLTKHGARIEALEFAQLSDDSKQVAPKAQTPDRPAVPDQAPKFEPRSSTLKLRVVDEDD